MPYTARKVGDQYCVYKKDTGKKVGCTDGNKEALTKYMAALHMNAKENINELRLDSHGVKEILKAILKKPEVIVKLGFKKFKDVIEHLKNADIDEQDALEQELKDLGVNVVYESKEQKLRKIIREEVRKALKAKK
jgi:hypothetical protein